MNDIKIPKVGLTFSRKLMPQLGSTDQFLKNLDKENIKYKKVSVEPENLKASQSEFNIDAVRSIMTDPKKTKSSIVISKDNYILDGHHRWIADYNKGVKTQAIMVDLPILELMRVAKTFDTTTYKDIQNVGPVIKKVVAEAVIARKYK